jgi:hypothetical protein
MLARQQADETLKSKTTLNKPIEAIDISSEDGLG